MLHIISLEGHDLCDSFGPVYRFLAPRNPQRVEDAFSHVMCSDAPELFKGLHCGYAKELKRADLPRVLDRAAWSDMGKLQKDVVRILIVNGFGGAYGDTMIGTAIVEQIHHSTAQLGKRASVDFLLRSLGFVRKRHFDIYKHNPHIHRMHFGAIPLLAYKEYDYVIDNDSFAVSEGFKTQNVYDHFMSHIGLDVGDLPVTQQLRPNPRIIAEVEAEIGTRRANDAGKCVLLNLFATTPRGVPQAHWQAMLSCLLPDVQVLLTAPPGAQGVIRELLGSLSPQQRRRVVDLSDLTARSFDHLIATIGSPRVGPDAVLTPDTSILHIAGALSVPCVGIFVTIDPERSCKYYPKVLWYCPEPFRQSPYWGLSYVMPEELQQKNSGPGTVRNPDPPEPEGWSEPAMMRQETIVKLWDQVDFTAIRALVDRAIAIGEPRSGTVEPTASSRPGIHADFAVLRHVKPRVLVYSGSAFPLPEEVDRTSLLSGLLPVDCEVEMLRLRPLDFHSLADIDLVVLGLGDLFHQAILQQPGLVDFIASARRVVGLFGFQYHDSLPLPIARALVGKLDAWFASTQHDLDLAGAAPDTTGATRCHWLGEPLLLQAQPSPWQIDGENPPADPFGPTTLNTMTMAMTISQGRWIQRYRRAHCRNIRELAWAACSAERIRLSEPKSYRDHPSGYLRHLLADLKGAKPTDDVWTTVDRTAWQAYRCRVEEAVQHARSAVAQLIGKL